MDIASLFLQCLLNELVNGCLGPGIDHRINSFSVLVQNQGWNHFHLCFLCELSLLINVDPCCYKLLAILLRNLFIGRANPAAITAPRCPEVHQDRLVPIYHLLKLFLIHIDSRHAGQLLSFV